MTYLENDYVPIDPAVWGPNGPFKNYEIQTIHPSPSNSPTCCTESTQPKSQLDNILSATYPSGINIRKLVFPTSYPFDSRDVECIRDYSDRHCCLTSLIIHDASRLSKLDLQQLFISFHSLSIIVMDNAAEADDEVLGLLSQAVYIRITGSKIGDSAWTYLLHNASLREVVLYNTPRVSEEAVRSATIEKPQLAVHTGSPKPGGEYKIWLRGRVLKRVVDGIEEDLKA